MKLLALAALVAVLVMPTTVQAQVLNLVPNGDFEIAAGDSWTSAGPATATYEETGGNPGRYGELDSAAGWGVFVSEVDPTNGLPLDSLGLVAGETYDFQWDMIDFGAGGTLGGNKLESWAGGVILDAAPDEFKQATTTDWATYTASYTIDPAATSIKFVPLSVDGGRIGFDNVGVLVAGDALLGDFDNDGNVDLADLDQYIGKIGETIAANPGLAALDLDGNETIDAGDFEQHYTDLVETSNGQTGTFAGDADLNGLVDVLGDAAILINNLNTSSTSWSQGDFNADGIVDVLGDAAALINNLGSSNVPASAPATSAVPEPGSLSLIALGMTGLVARRRRS